MLHKMVKLSYDSMMAKFLPPVTGEPDPESLKNIFDKVPTDSQEVKMYGPLAAELNKYATKSTEPGSKFVVVTTDARPDKTDRIQRKADLGMYPKESTAVTQKRTNWAEVELSIEVKKDGNCDPFEPSSNEAKSFQGQMTSYTEQILQRQQRTHYYNLAIFGNNARISRWDRSGCVYSNKFDYKAEPAKLVLFVLRLAHAKTPDIQGHDSTATRILEGSDEYRLMVACAQPTHAEGAKPPPGDHAREIFAKHLNPEWPWWKLTVPETNPKMPPREYLVAKPTFAAPGVVGRGTRGYVALDLTDVNHPFVYLKDCWRMVHPRSEMEGAILQHLNGKGVCNVPTALYHGNVGEEVTMARDIWMEANPGQEAKCRFKDHRHYRLVVKEVGKPLTEFSNGRQLVWVVLNALCAHEDAYTKAHTIHRDISVGNILILPDPTIDKFGCSGLLSDWELSKHTTDQDEEPRHPDRTGTWQFMSVNALDKPTKQIDIPDELESFFHVLLYCAIRFLPHNCRDVGGFMTKYFDDGEPLDATHKEYASGQLKGRTLESGILKAPNHSPIFFLRAPLPAPPTTTKVSTATATDALPPSRDGGGTSTPSRPSTPSPSSRSAPQSMPTPDSEIAQADRHPIEPVLNELLEHFSALYTLQERARLAKDGTSQRKRKTIPESHEPVTNSAIMKRYLPKNPKPDTPKPNEEEKLKDLEKKVKALKSHEEVGKILASAVEVPDDWPDVDKQDDQLKKTYRPDKEEKDAVVKPEKRNELHDGPLEEPESRKRHRSTASWA